MFITKKDFERKIENAIMQDREQVDMLHRYYELSDRIDDLQAEIRKLTYRFDRLSTIYTIPHDSNTINIKSTGGETESSVTTDELYEF